MDVPHLVKMANQIGQFFETWPDLQQAETEIASHIVRFWAPPMRTAIRTHLLEAGGEGLTPLVRRAIARLEPSRP